MSRLPGFDYRRPYFYMVTLKKLKGALPFCQITREGTDELRVRAEVPAGGELPTLASWYVIESELTRLFRDVILTFHEQWWCIEPITCFAIMPDHIHLIIKLRDIERCKSLPVIVWQLTKALETAYFAVAPAATGTGRAPTAHINCDIAQSVDGVDIAQSADGGDIAQSVDGVGKRSAEGDCGRPHCLSADWHDWVVKAQGQLATFNRYIRENAYRAWLRQQNAAYFGRVSRVCFLGREMVDLAIAGLPHTVG